MKSERGRQHLTLTFVVVPSEIRDHTEGPQYSIYSTSCHDGSKHPLTIIDLLDIIHHPVFSFKNVSETGLCLRNVLNLWVIH
jgi:hypothetical protein